MPGRRAKMDGNDGQRTYKGVRETASSAAATMSLKEGVWEKVPPPLPKAAYIPS